MLKIRRPAGGQTSPNRSPPANNHQSRLGYWGHCLAILLGLLAGKRALAQGTPASSAPSAAVESTPRSQSLGLTAGGQEPQATSAARDFGEVADYHRGELFVGAEYFRLALTDGQTISTVGIGTGMSYGVSQNFAICGSMKQAFSPKDGYANLFSAFDVGVTYALTGKMLTSDTQTTENQWQLLHYKEHDGGGFRATLSLSQYFLNAQDRALSFSGYGGYLSYDKPLTERFGVALGIGVDHLSNGSTLLLPIRAFLRTTLRL